MPGTPYSRIIRTAIAVALAAWVSSAHDPTTTPVTFSREISRLLNGRCAGCHREGGSAFSLLTYGDARPWAKAIKEEVLERRMPPWGAIKGFGEFRDDQSLTQEQIDTIAEWVEGGAPEGDRALLPAPPDPEEKPAASLTLPEIVVKDSVILKSRAAVAGIRARGLREGASLMVTAERPDGSVAPLLWLYGYNPRFARTYWYRAAIALPAGTKIGVAPPVEAGAIALLVK